MNSNQSNENPSIELLEPFDWRCKACGHVESPQHVRCTECSYLRLPTLINQSVDAESPSVRKDDIEPDESCAVKVDDDALLHIALQQIELLFDRVRSDRRLFTDLERGELYEHLLTSLLKAEREKIRRHLVRYERERLHAGSRLKLSILWLSGFMVGLLFVYLLHV